MVYNYKFYFGMRINITKKIKKRYKVKLFFFPENILNYLSKSYKNIISFYAH